MKGLVFVYAVRNAMKARHQMKNDKHKKSPLWPPKQCRQFAPAGPDGQTASRFARCCTRYA
tara:strand:+ start:33 stop:215 length:183 start_codon:yes stop_codon:yes gene_type:complete